MKWIEILITVAAVAVTGLIPVMVIEGYDDANPKSVKKNEATEYPEHHIKHVTYKGHKYIGFWDRVLCKTVGFVHDPDCPCSKDTNNE